MWASVCPRDAVALPILHPEDFPIVHSFRHKIPIHVVKQAHQIPAQSGGDANIDIRYLSVGDHSKNIG